MEENDEKKIDEQAEVLEDTKSDVPQSNETSGISQVTSVEETEEKTKQLDKSEKKKGKKGIVALIIIIILIIAAVVGWFVFFNKPVEKESTTTKAKEVHSKYRLSGNDLQNFDLYFLQLENPTKNSVYSPLSIKYALEMLGEGAKGETKDQIDAVVGDYKAKKYVNNSHMSFANAMFIRNDFKDNIKEEYTKKLVDKYNAEVQYADFSDPKPVNNWVSNKTFKLIDNLFDDVSDYSFILINALAIDMNWVNRIQAANAPLPDGMKQMSYGVNYNHEKFYDYVDTIDGDDSYPAMKFNGIDNIKSVEVAASFNHYDIIKDKGEDNIRKTVTDDYQKYLNEHPEEANACPSVKEYVDKYIVDIGENYKKSDISTDYYISDTENEKVFAKNLQTYDGTTLQYVGIMPKKDDLTSYVKNMNAKKLSNVINGMKEVKYENFDEGVITNIHGNIPLFKYEYQLELGKDLNELGIKNIFDKETVNLDNMLSDGTKQVIDPTHKATIEFSNDGIKAAAATAMAGLGAAGACGYDYEFEVPVKKIDITFDKPYMYIIRDKDSGEVWFVGTVYEPIKK